MLAINTHPESELERGCSDIVILDRIITSVFRRHVIARMIIEYTAGMTVERMLG